MSRSRHGSRCGRDCRVCGLDLADRLWLREHDGAERERVGLELVGLLGGYEGDDCYLEWVDDDLERTACLCPEPWDCLGDCLPEHPAPGVRFIAAQS